MPNVQDRQKPDGDPHRPWNPRLAERIDAARAKGYRVDVEQLHARRGGVAGSWVTLTWRRLMKPVSTGFPAALDFHLVDLLFDDLVVAARRPRPQKTPLGAPPAVASTTAKVNSSSPWRKDRGAGREV